MSTNEVRHQLFLLGERYSRLHGEVTALTIAFKDLNRRLEKLEEKQGHLDLSDSPLPS